jgi:hypothetical protein
MYIYIYTYIELREVEDESLIGDLERYMPCGIVRVSPMTAPATFVALATCLMSVSEALAFTCSSARACI